MVLVVIEEIEHYVGHNSVMELSIVTIDQMKKDSFVVSLIDLKIFHIFFSSSRIELCVNNLYSCPPKDDLRCDLACQMLHYVPCQSIQDRRACQYFLKPSQ